MTKINPKGPTPSLIGSTNGRPRRTTVIRKSTCYRCHAELLAGHSCIEIPKLDGAYSTPKRVCDECFQGILRKTAVDLEEIKAL
jgi:hypothetical protein